MGDPVRVLNNRGIQGFREYLGGLRKGAAIDPPLDMLTDPRYSAKIHGIVEVERYDFKSKLEMARNLYERLRILPHSQTDQNVGLWSWISLYYFDQICPKNRIGRRIAGQDSRHILDPDYRLYYRHLLSGPYNVYKLHEGKAPLLFYGPLFVLNSYYRQLACRQAFITNSGVIEAANLLYYDSSIGKPKFGATSKTGKPGTIFRFIDVIQQLDLTYDLYSMSGEEVLDLLPPEFDQWRPPKDLFPGIAKN